MRREVRRTIYHLVLWLIALLFFMPVLWIVLAAFKTKGDLLAVPVKWAFVPTLDNFADLVRRHDFFSSLENSFLISAAAVVVALAVAFLAAYCFSCFPSGWSPPRPRWSPSSSCTRRWDGRTPSWA